jgi:ligand-binding sensor domain-containing protein/signal transduction histidine kinase
MNEAFLINSPRSGRTRIVQRFIAGRDIKHGEFLLFVVLLALVAAPDYVMAEQLPVKTYTIADGLARDSINCIFQDSHGFIWFCTAGGLSRFNGYVFTNYDTSQGLADNYISNILETRSGVYWVATADSLCLFNPHGFEQKSNGMPGERPPAGDVPPNSPKFIVFHRDTKELWGIKALVEDRQGTVWCGTQHGLYKLTSNGSQWTLEFVNALGGAVIETILEDRRGALWISSSDGVYRRWPDGRIEHYTVQHGLPTNYITALLEDGDGRLWMGSEKGLCRAVADPDPGRRLVEHVFTTRDGLPGDQVSLLFQARNGKMWAVIPNAMITFDPAAPLSQQKVQSYSTANGLSDKIITALAEDHDDNLWVGTESGGAMKITNHGFITYREADGISQPRINSIFEDRAGELCVVGLMTDKKLSVGRFDGRRFDETLLKLPAGQQYSWGWYQFVLQDHLGEWWIPTARGVYRFPATANLEELARLRPKAIYTAKDGLTADEVFRLFEDSRGDIWIGTIAAGKDTLTRWERATGTFHRYSSADGIPAAAPTAFREDNSGNLWIGFYVGGLVRYRDGRFTPFNVSNEPNAPGFVRALYLDHLGRLWVAMSPGGAIRIDDPGAEHPHFVVYSANEGLGSGGASCVTEDQWGSIYIGTGRGLDQLDSASGRIKHYSTADGLAQNYANISFRDRNGALWFGTLNGLSRLNPEPDQPAQSPPILIGSLRIAGVTYPLSDLGETEIGRLELKPDQNQVQLDFFSLGFRSGELLRYQYVLEGADRDWGAPTNQRSVTYANLKPGSYRFMVRALNAEGLVSQAPAIVSFTIDPPIWQRWWFFTIALIMVGLTIYAVYRYRLARLLEMERMRTRIAADLHDDIGASLSRVAIMSEVLKRQSGARGDGAARMLTEIAESARASVDSMSDIVWSIDPRRDNLNDVVLRVRQFASDVLEACGIKWEFQVSPEAEKVKLDAEHRRHLLLIFKEAINNIVRHAGCNFVRLSISVESNQVKAEIHDDGQGFADQPEEAQTDGRGGHGLKNIRARTAELRGRCEIATSPSKGTHLTIEFPLK